MKASSFFLLLVLIALGTGCASYVDGERPITSRSRVTTMGTYSVVGAAIFKTKDGFRVHPAPRFKVIVHNFSNDELEIRRDGGVLAQVPNGASHTIGFACEPDGNQMNLLLVTYQKRGEQVIVKNTYSEVLVTGRSESYMFGSYSAGIPARQRVMAYMVKPDQIQRDTAGWW
jgi:hypothetical protein